MQVISFVLLACLILQSCCAYSVSTRLFGGTFTRNFKKVATSSTYNGFHSRIEPLSVGKIGSYAHKKRPVPGGGKSKVRIPLAGEPPPPLLNPDGTPALLSASGKKLKEDVIEVQGRITDALPGTMFRVEIEPSKQSILCTISGKIRKNNIKLLVGDFITAEMSIFDLTKGRITFRKRL